MVVEVAESVLRLATGWTVGGIESHLGRNFQCRPDHLRGPSLLYNVYRAFSGVKAAGDSC